jgi:hypothetical protein
MLAAAFVALLGATFMTATEVVRPHVLITNDDGINAPGTDVQKPSDGFVTLTPLSLNQTGSRALPTLMVIPWSLTRGAAGPTRAR